MGDGYVDLTLVSDDAAYRDDEGTEHVVDSVTQQDLDLAGRGHRDRRRAGGRRRPGFDHRDRVSPRHGAPRPRGRGTIGDDVRDATGRLPILWFQDTDEHETPRQRFHVGVWVPPEVAEQRIPPSSARVGSPMTARRRRTQ